GPLPCLPVLLRNLGVPVVLFRILTLFPIGKPIGLFVALGPDHHALSCGGKHCHRRFYWPYSKDRAEAVDGAAILLFCGSSILIGVRLLQLEEEVHGDFTHFARHPLLVQFLHDVQVLAGGDIVPAIHRAGERVQTLCRHLQPHHAGVQPVVARLVGALGAAQRVALLRERSARFISHKTRAKRITTPSCKVPTGFHSSQSVSSSSWKSAGSSPRARMARSSACTL